MRSFLRNTTLLGVSFALSYWLLLGAPEEKAPELPLQPYEIAVSLVRKKAISPLAPRRANGQVYCPCGTTAPLACHAGELHRLTRANPSS